MSTQTTFADDEPYLSDEEFRARLGLGDNDMLEPAINAAADTTISAVARLLIRLPQ